MPAHRRGPWSQAEDQALMILVSRQGASNWVRISQMIQTRSPKQCRERYHQNLKPNLNHTPITAEEGRQIEDLVNTIGKRWAEIARRLPGRSDNAVKNWWNGGQNRRRRAIGGRSRESSGVDHSQMYDPSNPGYPRDRIYLPPPLSLPAGTSSFDRPMVSPAYPAQAMYGQGKARPEPLDLGMHAHMGMGRYGYPTPLPSPSGHPSTSPESAGMGADGSLSISPLTPIGLPPLIGGRDERRQTEVAWLPANTTGFVGSDGHFEPFQRQSYGPVFREPQWHPRRDSPLQRLPKTHGHPDFMMAQQPLPAYETIHMNIPPPMHSILPSQTLSPPSGHRAGMPMSHHVQDMNRSKSHASPSAPGSPNSMSLHNSSPSSRNTKMAIASLV